MDCGVESMKSFSLFNIDINLTKKGEKHMEKVNSIILGFKSRLFIFEIIS